MTRARNIAGFSTITTTPSPIHVGPIGVLTATRIDGEFNVVDTVIRDITAQGIGVTNLQVSGITTGLNVSGIITAQNGINFNGTSTGLNVSGVTTVADLTATTISIGGTLTYEDVTSVDSVGVVTARGLSIFGNTTGLNATGVSTFTGDVSIADKIIHTGDTNTALRFPAADTITAETGGTERLRITDDGRIGLHDSTPNDYELDIQKRSTATDAQIRLYNNATGSGNDTVMRYHIAGTSGSNYIYFGDGDDPNVGQIRYSHTTNSMQFTTGASERLRITSAGLVGIGTDNPLNPLVVRGADPQIRIVDSENENNAQIFLDGPNSNFNFDWVSGANRKINFLNSGSGNLNVGIGTDIPVSTLHVTSDANNLFTLQSTDRYSTAYLVDTIGSSFIQNDSGALRFATGGGASAAGGETERLRITSGGDIGINIASPARGPLHIHDSSSDTVNIHLTNNDSGAGSQDGLTIFMDGNSSAGIWYRENAAFRIATNNTERFQITSTGRIDQLYNNENIDMDSSANGQLRLDGNGYAAGFALNAQGLNIYHNSSTRAMIFGTDETERVRINSDGTVRIGINNDALAQLELRYSTVPAYLTNTFDGTVGEATLSVNVPRTSAGSGSWGSHSNTGYGSAAIQALSHSSTGGYVSILTAPADNTNPTEKLRIDEKGSVRHMGTAGYYQITVIYDDTNNVWRSGSGPQRIRPNFIDNRTGYAEYIIEFHPSVSYSGYQQPTFVICGGDGGLKTGGTIELNTNRRTNSPTNGQFRSYHGQFSWQMYNDGDTDHTSGQQEINRNVEHRSSSFINTSTQSVDYIANNDARYGTNVEPIIDQRSYIKIKMNGTNAIQGHPFVCRFVIYSQGDKEWFGYMQYDP